MATSAPAVVSTRPVGPYSDIVAAIGETPLVELPRLSPGPRVRIFAKLEGNNPSGSVKDRIARAMIEWAEERGELTPDRTILEPTSGNTGIGLAMIARRKGYRMVAVIPDNVSPERRGLLESFGAELVLTVGAKGSNGAIAVAEELARDPRYYMPYQYGNPANPQAHYDTTGPEILRDLPDLDVFVAGLGTGTLMGVGRRLKEHDPSIQVVAAEPHPGEQVQGLRNLADGFIPPVLDLARLDRKVVVTTENAVHWTRELAFQEGIFAGEVSSGAAIHVARRVAERMESGKIVVLLADGGWKYLSSGLWTRPFDEACEVIRRGTWW